MGAIKMSKLLSLFTSTLSTVFTLTVLAVVVTGIVAVADTAGWRVPVAGNSTNIQLPVSLTQSLVGTDNTDQS